MESRGRTAIFFGLVAVVFWSASAPFSNLLRGHASFPVIVLFMQIGATIALLIHASIKENGLSELASDLQRLTLIADSGGAAPRPRVWKTWLYLIAFGLCITAYHSLFFYSLQNGPSLQLNMINYLWPVNLVIISSIMFKRNVQNAGTFLEFFLVPLAFFGAIIIGFEGHDFTHLEFSWPLVAAFAASLFAPLYMAIGPKIVGEGHVLNSRHMYIFSLTLMSILQIAAYFPSGVLRASVVDLWAIPVSMVLGLMSIAIAHVCWNDALESSRRATISTLIYLTPILSSVWLVSFFDEPVTGQFLLGASIILLANVLMSRALDEFLPAIFAIVVCGYATVAWFARSLFGDPQLVPEAYQIVPGIFAILAGFMLSRMWSRNAQLETLYINWVYAMRSVRNDARSLVRPGRGRASRLREIENQVDDLLTLSLDVKVPGDGPPAASGLLLNAFGEFADRLQTLGAGRGSDWAEKVERVELAMIQWVNRVEDRSSWPEMAVIMLLGAGSIISLIVQLGYSVPSMLLSIAFSFCVAFIVAEIRVYEHMSARVCFVALINGSLRDLFKDGKPYLPRRWLVTALCRRGAKLDAVRYRTPEGSVVEISSSELAAMTSRTRTADVIVGVLALICTAGMMVGLIVSQPAVEAIKLTHERS